MFLTRAQSAGRGTRGRSFESPEGGGLYMSLLLYPEIHAKNSYTLTCAAAVAVCRAIEKECPNIAPRIKWVNDIYVGERKLAGILTEGECAEDGALRYAIVGIGINLKKAPHSPEVEAIMTSLEDEGATVDAPALSAEVTAELISVLNGGEVLEEYKNRSMLIDREVEISSGGECHTERVLDIDGECALITVGADGEEKRYISGDVKVRPQKGG